MLMKVCFPEILHRQDSRIGAQVFLLYWMGLEPVCRARGAGERSARPPPRKPRAGNAKGRYAGRICRQSTEMPETG